MSGRLRPRHGELFFRVLREVAVGGLSNDLLELAYHLAERGGIEFGIELGATLLLLRVKAWSNEDLGTSSTTWPNIWIKRR